MVNEYLGGHDGKVGASAAVRQGLEGQELLSLLDDRDGGLRHGGFLIFERGGEVDPWSASRVPRAAEHQWTDENS